MTIAFWCILIAIILPYIWFAIANIKSGKLRNNEEPRDFFLRIDGMAKRAIGAHLNSFESNIWFIAGVLVASLAHAPQNRIDIVAIIFVLARIFYGFFYIFGKGTLRSLMFLISFLATISFFFLSM